MASKHWVSSPSDEREKRVPRKEAIGTLHEGKKQQQQQQNNYVNNIRQLSKENAGPVGSHKLRGKKLAGATSPDRVADICISSHINISHANSVFSLPPFPYSLLTLFFRTYTFRLSQSALFCLFCYQVLFVVYFTIRTADGSSLKTVSLTKTTRQGL